MTLPVRQRSLRPAYSDDLGDTELDAAMHIRLVAPRERRR